MGPVKAQTKVEPTEAESLFVPVKAQTKVVLTDAASLQMESAKAKTMA